MLKFFSEVLLLKKIKILNTNQLKYIAAVFMVLDSAFFAFHGILPLPSWIHLITRFVAPLFAYLTVEGFFHTKNRKKHLIRLWAAAILMQAGDFLSLLLLGQANCIPDNIFLTLAVGYSFMYFASIGTKAFRKISGSAIFIFGLFLSTVGIHIGKLTITLEGGIPLLFLMLIFWRFYGNRKKQLTYFAIWSIFSFLLMGPDINPSHFKDFSQWFDMFCYNSDAMSFLFLPFLLIYSGKKGSYHPIHKWFFYIFYPLHLWILHAIAFMLTK